VKTVTRSPQKEIITPSNGLSSQISIQPCIYPLALPLYNPCQRVLSATIFRINMNAESSSRDPCCLDRLSGGRGAHTRVGTSIDSCGIHTRRKALREICF
jgi:hypothetical protein